MSTGGSVPTLGLPLELEGARELGRGKRNWAEGEGEGAGQGEREREPGRGIEMRAELAPVGRWQQHFALCSDGPRRTCGAAPGAAPSGSARPVELLVLSLR